MKQSGCGRKLRQNGHIYAHIEMAKYYEHKRRDVKTALQWTLSALEHAEQADLPAYMRKHWLDEINYRLDRLERKDSIRERVSGD